MQASTGPTPGMEVSSRYRCASAASVRDDLDQALVEHVDIGGEPSDATARKTLQHRIFQQSRGILGGDFLRR